ncbi:hypothetical protein C8D70_12313 [Chryseobacterium sp. CBTAP 102]|uniref:hypothetical protein n=1 Tax=Chryseobacterium sp. CBTAP 102 TaxID=2135644 RepID=UPI000D875F54|nr:hypothetical protein [Chryseobacterium sp. CBTAP 102]PXW07098.1 hypothetical protein C8D70_12313 [Chryseobacterium sp. CBTAP 102]
MKKLLVNSLTFTAVLACNMLFAGGIGLGDAVNEVLGDVKQAAAGIVIIGFLITCIVAVNDYSSHKDVGQALRILLYGVLITLAIVGAYAFIKTRVKFN